jgi:peptidoglycan/LPS O-acetylase OafA/YrhL
MLLKYYNSLNSLRGYTALMVILSHLPQVTENIIPYVFYKIVAALQLGYFGVDIFFVLSGFLVTRIILFDKSQGSFSLIYFYIKRALRIFPIYFLMVSFVHLFITKTYSIFALTYTYNYYYAFNPLNNPLEHTWSLCVEEHFYIVAPLLIKYLKVSIWKTILLYGVLPFVLISIIGFIYFSLNPDVAKRLVFSSTNTRILSLVMGGVIAYKEKYILSYPNKRPFIYLLSFGMPLIYGIACSVSVLGFLIKHSSIGIYLQIIKFFLFAILSASTIIIFILLENRTFKSKYVLTNNISSFIGKISYGLYLYHYPIVYIFGRVKYGSEYTGIVCMSDAFFIISIPILLATISYYFIELPILRFKNTAQCDQFCQAIRLGLR